MTYQFFHFIVLTLATIYVVTQSSFFSFSRVLIAKVAVKCFPPALAFYAIQLIYCPACFGFWVGLTASLLGTWPGQSNLEAACFTMLLGVCWSRLFSDGSVMFANEINTNDDFKTFAETIGLRAVDPVHDHYNDEYMAGRDANQRVSHDENWR